jgi:hypothetical protein
MLFEEDDEPFCAYARADLLVSGDNINAEELTRLLGSTPTEVAKEGDCTGWRLSSESYVPFKNLERHIHWILDQIEGKESVITTLKAERGCQIDLGCWWTGSTPDASGPLLTHETIKRIGNFDLNLIFSISVSA